jgi:Permuted papain-like amidase enzyme, YaeF/YiiX, C92 family
MFTRRHFLAATAMALCVPSAHTRADPPKADGNLPFPNREKFEVGDLLWPKSRCAKVPYASAHYQSQEEAKLQWTKERDAFVGRIHAAGQGASEDEAKAARNVESMTYEEFTRLYFYNEKAHGIQPYGSDAGLETGHVAILLEDAHHPIKKNPIVLEAVWGDIKKVRTISYDDWLTGRPDELVWHGRLKGIDFQGRSNVAKEALSHLNKPYNFWNMNLDDDSGFYCSKLVWLAAYRSLEKLALDDHKSPRRSIWFSPKQLMHCPHVFLINDPGNYASSQCDT